MLPRQRRRRVQVSKKMSEDDIMDVEQLIEAVITREGGYVADPADRGGATCWGITERVARRHGYVGPMRDLPKREAAAIYRQRYWLVPKLDRIAVRAPGLAGELFDTGVNMGPAVAIGFLQRALNALNRGASDYPDIAVDGMIGPKTLAALDGFLARRSSEEVLIRAVDVLQGARYLALAEARPADEAFVYGWLGNRVCGHA
jgi:lysozyme family protein